MRSKPTWTAMKVLALGPRVRRPRVRASTLCQPMDRCYRKFWLDNKRVAEKLPRSKIRK